MKTSKRFAAITISLILSALILTACGGSASDPAEGENKSYTVGVIQFATHPSLDNCYEGFVKGLAEKGLVDGKNLTIDFQNANLEMSNSDLQAKNMVTSNCDLIVGIATPAAMSAYAAAKDSDIPVVFTAVSDPVHAGIVKSLDAPGGNCTGSADILDFDAQVGMIKGFLPNAKTIGVIYTTSEANSVSQLARLTEVAEANGLAVESIGVTNGSEVGQAAAALIAKGVDCFNNLTDNNMVDNLTTVLHKTDEAGIPVFGSEIEQVKNGCLASQSIDYVELGRVTGVIAADIILGTSTPATTPVAIESVCFPVYNSAVAEKLNLTLPSEFSDIMDTAK
ncbi:MAG: ABC transporter substrate-binding protein [Oscillospiraceae bacterium]